ncbi:MAG: glycine cleavage system protein GcvH [Alphaproteobacteria bacterium]|nr:glycine cleavage system protein GcvH [Alphaproteobacteria bacterium]
MSDLKFTEEHEWVRVEGDVAVCGISDYAQDQLGDVVYVELPAVGSKVVKLTEIAVVESVKAASDIYAPVSGEVIAVNETLTEQPNVVNADPTGEGWFFQIQLSDPAELDDLMDEDAYRTYVEELS